jgi:hypothetical protein
VIKLSKIKMLNESTKAADSQEKPWPIRSRKIVLLVAIVAALAATKICFDHWGKVGAASLKLPDRLSCDASESAPSVWENGAFHFDFITPIATINTPTAKTLYLAKYASMEGQDRVLSIVGKTDVLTGISKQVRDNLKIHPIENLGENVFRVALTGSNNPSGPPIYMTCLGQN